jgi:2-polyprenyl-3-methyl-5-hydroxy-6-metoxy-1,4-benzoquinol methylase
VKPFQLPPPELERESRKSKSGFRAVNLMSTMACGLEYADARCLHEWLLDDVICLLDSLVPKGARIIDLGCGNGRLTARLRSKGWPSVGVDISPSGIQIAKETYPGLDFRQVDIGSASQPFPPETFGAAVAVEVIEHLHDPKQFLRNALVLLRPSGWLVITTPYHGYLKNLAISLLDGWDSHFDALSVGGHIKFWSKRTLAQLFASLGLDCPHYWGAGRVPLLWKSVIVAARKPFLARAFS